MSIDEFLLARITEDEAERVTRYRAGHLPTPRELREAARWEAECAAKRQIVEMHAPMLVDLAGLNTSVIACSLCDDAYPCRTVKHLAAVYADHLDYNSEWGL